MRQISWNEMFVSRGEGLTLVPEVPVEPTGWRRLLWWEDWLSFGLLGVLFLSVAASIQASDWVDDMPPLIPIALFGLLVGALLSRLRWPEGFIHLLALPIGAAAILAQLLAIVSGPHPVDRFQAITTRMGAWFDAAFTGGISNDSLPFIIVVVSLTWLAAYMSAWAVFRWQNAWLALVPGGSALLVNLGFQSAGFSVAVVSYLFASALLLTRMHLVQQTKAWRDRGTPYPPLLSLSVLHATFWVAFLLLGLAWIMPKANEVGPLEAAWARATDPVIQRTGEFGRLFVSVHGGGGQALLRRYGNVVPFRGAIDLSDEEILSILTEELDQPYYLRGDVYQIYTPEGWFQDSDQTLHPRAGEDISLQSDELRHDITVQVVPQGNTGDTLFTVGEPRSVDRRSEARAGTNNLADVISLENQSGRLSSDDDYKATGSVSAATEDNLRAAGTNYPGWVEDRYKDLPDELPFRVINLARSIAGDRGNPYDQAVAIETYLRNNYDYTLDVPEVPLNRDAIDFFLFDSKEGYFDYHASAMVVLLRSLGVPSRLVVGYVLNNGESGAKGERFVVTEADAFAWPEVFFPGFGWVEFNPSPAPGLGPIHRPGGAAVNVPPNDARPNDPPVDLGALGAGFPQGEGAQGGALPHAGGGNGLWVLLGVLLGLGLVVVSGGGGLRYAWVRGIGGLDEPARLWGQTQRLASWARLPVDSAQTPYELARRLRDDMPGADGVELLADAYVRHRYGRWQPDEDALGQLESAWRTVRAGLLRRLFRLPSSKQKSL